jgi:hypothetical protein
MSPRRSCESAENGTMTRAAADVDDARMPSFLRQPTMLRPSGVSSASEQLRGSASALGSTPWPDGTLPPGDCRA